jgi:hypothetical protein
MTGGPDLISLLHRADWTGLSLSAEVNDGSRLLIAPGRRYRLQTAEYVTGCDGDRPWELSKHDVDGHVDGREVDGTVHWVSGPEPPLRALLCPAWLLKSSRLEERGRVSACGRDALRVVVTRRQGIGGRTVPAQFPAGRAAEVIVDAELGILLRIAWMAGGEGRMPKMPKRRSRMTIRHLKCHRTACLPGRSSATRPCTCCMTVVPVSSPPHCTNGMTTPPCCHRYRQRHAGRASAGLACSWTR